MSCLPETDKCDCEVCTCGKQKIPRIIRICMIPLCFHRLALVYLLDAIEYKMSVLSNNFWAEFAKNEREKRRNIY